VRATPIDWAQIRRRLAGAAVRDADALTAEQADAVLAQRARALAAAVVPEVDRTARLDALIVRIAGERYALAAGYLWRVVGAADIAPVPGAPQLLLGVMNLHGEVLPVFDPRPLLGLAGERPAGRVQVVVLGAERADLGLAVDAADEVIGLRTDQLHAAPDSLAPARRELLRGVMQDGLILLDGRRLMADPRLVVAAPD
jgi:purine-binding chemotaxis protein CheW